MAVVVALLPAEAQPAHRVWRIGYLGGASREPLVQMGVVEAFESGLRDRGYVEGRNVVLEYRFADGQLERMRGRALGQTLGTAQRGLSARVAGGRALGSFFPRAGRGSPANGGGRSAVEAHAPARTGSGRRRHRECLRRHDEGTGGSLILVGADSFTLDNRAVITALAARHRMPAIYPLREFVEAGGLLSYDVNLREQFRRAATYVDRILKGAKPADLPVEQPTKLELAINLKSAKTLGLTIPQSLQLRANQVIE